MHTEYFTYKYLVFQSFISKFTGNRLRKAFGCTDNELFLDKISIIAPQEARLCPLFTEHFNPHHIESLKLTLTASSESGKDFIEYSSLTLPQKTGEHKWLA